MLLLGLKVIHSHVAGVPRKCSPLAMMQDLTHAESLTSQNVAARSGSCWFLIRCDWVLILRWPCCRISPSLTKGFDMLAMLRNHYEKYLRRKRKKEILEQCGCVCYCPHCKDPLNDQAIWVSEGAVGPSYGPRAGIFRCRQCNGSSRWMFDVAPFPVLDKEYGKPIDTTPTP